jgi:hypothetical protein
MEVCILHTDGKATRWSARTDAEGRKRLARQLRADDIVGIEACVFAFSLEVSARIGRLRNNRAESWAARNHSPIDEQDG